MRFQSQRLLRLRPGCTVHHEAWWWTRADDRRMVLRLSICISVLLIVVLPPGDAWAVAPDAPKSPDTPGVPGTPNAPDTPNPPDADREIGASPRLQPGVFHLGFDSLYVGFEGNGQWREVRSASRRLRTTQQDNRDLYFREVIGFGLHGDVVDPGLVDFTANLELGLNQIESFERLGHLENQRSDSGFLSDFDVNLDFFRDKPISANVYGRRSDSRVARRFLPSLRERTSQAGATIQAVTGDVTTHLGFTWEDVERTGNRRLEDDERLTTRRLFADSTWQISDNHSLKLSYDHEQQNSNFQGSNFRFGVIRDELRLEHDLRFGPDHRHSLSSFIRYNRETGDLARDEFVANSRLSLQHTDAFRTEFRYGFYRFDQQAIRSDLHQFDLAAHYQPNDKWRLTLDGFYINESVDQDVDVDQFGANFDTSFRQPTAWGELNVNLAVAWDQQRFSSSVGRRTVRDEAHGLTDVRPLFLRQRNINVLSIIAHNLTWSRVYIVGVDYLILPIQDRVYVQRLAGGRIAMGDIVYFDYVYQVPTQARLDTVRTDLMIEHPFTFGLTPYYYFEGRFEHANNSPGTPLTRDNQARHRIGIRYQKPRYSASTEYEVFDDSIEPFNAFHLIGNTSVFRSISHSLDARGELSLYRFKGGVDAREVWWLDLGLTDRIQFDPYLSLATTAAYRREDDSVDGITDAVDLEVVLAYTRNYLSMELAFEYDLLSIADSRDEGFGVFLRVRRDLGHLLSNTGWYR